MKTILLIEDEPQMRRNVLRMLELEGFTAIGAEDGFEGISAATRHRPDLILCDVTMPGLDGWETIRRIRAQGWAAREDAGGGAAGAPGAPGACIAVVSANAFDKTLENDAGIRPEDFIVKPVRHSELLDWLERRLGLQWQYDEATTAPAGAEPAVASAAPAPLTYPDAAALLALAQAVSLG